MIEAVVMAAGEGRRLRPLTDRYAKPVLPIDGRPVLATLLRELADAGCPRATVVVGHLGEQVAALAGDGAGFGLEVRIAWQTEPLGSADAVRRAVAAGAAPPFIVTAADTLYAPGDVARFVEAFVSSGAAAALAGRREPPPGPSKPPVRFEGGHVARVVDDNPAAELSSAPLWAFGPAAARFLDGLSGPPYELSEALQRAVDAGEEVLGIEIGRTRDLTFPVDLVHQNFPYLRGA